jgi:hypothetical protein
MSTNQKAGNSKKESLKGRDKQLEILALLIIKVLGLNTKGWRSSKNKMFKPLQMNSKRL